MPHSREFVLDTPNFDSHCKILISKQSYQLSQPAALRALCCTSGMTSHRQPRQCRGTQGPKTAKGPKVTRIVYQDCYPVANGSLRNSMQKCGKILRGRKTLSPPWFQHCGGERPRRSDDSGPMDELKRSVRRRSNIDGRILAVSRSCKA